ncbi:MAG: hypothetical protein WBX20_14100, partial [Terrimicrobiaceae bacterium]
SVGRDPGDADSHRIEKLVAAAANSRAGAGQLLGGSHGHVPITAKRSGSGVPAAKRARKSAHAQKRSATPTVRTRKSAAHGFGIVPLDPRFLDALLLCGNQCPAN